MSTVQTLIGEHDRVALVQRFERWPAGTEGTVVVDHPTHKTVEIDGIEMSGDDLLEYLPAVPTEHLRLVWKCPPPAS